MTLAVFTGLIGTVGGLVIAYFGLRRSHRVDAVSEKSGIATDTRAGTAQVIDGLMALLDQVQEDNRDNRLEFKDVREAVKKCGDRLKEVLAERDEALLERNSARAEVAILRERLEGMMSKNEREKQMSGFSESDTNKDGTTDMTEAVAGGEAHQAAQKAHTDEVAATEAARRAALEVEPLPEGTFATKAEAEAYLAAATAAGKHPQPIDDGTGNGDFTVEVPSTQHGYETMWITNVSDSPDPAHPDEN